MKLQNSAENKTKDLAILQENLKSNSMQPRRQSVNGFGVTTRAPQIAGNHSSFILLEGGYGNCCRVATLTRKGYSHYTRKRHVPPLHRQLIFLNLPSPASNY